MARLRVPKPSDINEASRRGVEHRPKPAGSQTGDAETLTPEREALEHPHILFRFQRDPLLVAMSAPGLDERALRTPAAARKDAGSRARRGRGK